MQGVERAWSRESWLSLLEEQSSVRMLANSLNGRRRELLQVMLSVGGIVGGVVSGLRSSPQVLQVLIFFVFASVVLYSTLLAEAKRTGLRYELVVVAVAISFSLLFSEVIIDVIGNVLQGLVTLAIGTLVITLALLKDWEKSDATQDGKGDRINQ
jgi:hypothetical protein